MFRNRLSDEIVSAVQEQVREEIDSGAFVIPEDVGIESFKFDDRPGLLLEAKDYLDKIKEKYTLLDDKDEWILAAIRNILLVIALTISKDDSGMSLVENPTLPINVPGVKAEDITEEVLAGVPKDER